MLDENITHECRTFAIFLTSKFSLLTLTSLIDPLRIANNCSGKLLYKWEFLSAEGGDVVSSDEITVQTKAISDVDTRWDTVFVCSGWNAEHYDDPRVLHWLQSMARAGMTIGAVEMGSYILARANLLAGYAATIHWHCVNAFQERYPEVDIQEQVFVADRKRITCAGGSACSDMMLSDIASHYGKTLACDVADHIVSAETRPSTAQQKRAQSRTQLNVPLFLHEAIQLMDHNVEEPITIPEISTLLGLSQRKLERLFDRHFCCSAVTFYKALRLHRARTLLTQTNMPVIDICVATGFNSSSYFSKAYRDLFGICPSDHRRAWPDTKTLPEWPELITSFRNNAALRRA